MPFTEDMPNTKQPIKFDSKNFGKNIKQKSSQRKLGNYLDIRQSTGRYRDGHNLKT